MVCFKTKIGESKISGLGLFADEFIPKDSVVWKFEPGFDMLVEPKTLERLSPAAKEQLLKYAYVSKKSGKYLLPADDSRFINHSDDANLFTSILDGPGEEDITHAARDIQKGEELTADYRQFDEGLQEDYSTK